jgi:glycosidase
MTEYSATAPYFPHTIQIDAVHWQSLDLASLSRQISGRVIPDIIFYRQMALRLNRKRPSGSPTVHAGQLNMYATLLKVYRHLIDVTAEQQAPALLENALIRAGYDTAKDPAASTMTRFVEQFPPGDVPANHAAAWLTPATLRGERQRLVLRELLLLRMAAKNPALDSFREILDDSRLASASSYHQVVTGLEQTLSRSPRLTELDATLVEALLAPILASPDSLSGQVGFIREKWFTLLPPDLFNEVLVSFDILLEEERGWGGGGEPGPPPVMEFNRTGRPGAGHGGAVGFADGSSVFGGYDYPEYEHFSTDADWMSNVVLMAKMVYVWLDQLSKQHGWTITRLDQIPDAELDRLSAWGFTGLWLIGIWERSPASQHVKQLCGNPEAIASAYSLYDYEIAADLGGWEALHNLKERAARRGIRLASDMVPNHTGIYSRWVMQHPDWFVQTDYPPFPTYQFNGEDLSRSPDAVIQIEDGYWTKTDAAVVFRMIERNSGRIRYIYHGNDGTSIPWNDTAQLNYLIPEVREAVIQTILHVARSFPIIRFDAAMTLAKKHFQRLWFPVRGLGGGIPSRAGHGMSRDEFDAVFPVEFWRQVVDRVALEVPGTLLLAEAFWLMEGYFVRTLGMHRVYNSAFMNMLKQEENAKYRHTIKNVLEFNPEVLKRFVNFMNNPDEKTAVEQFGREGKYFGACVLLATMPGLPMFGHGQIEGYHEKYGMEYKRSYWDETPDGHLVWLHERTIFPLLRRRWLFSGSENFVLYDFFAGDTVNENVFAYSNRVGDQRSLVLYHNSYATTAGWIRQSVEFATQDADDGANLTRTTLGETLGLACSDAIFYAFSDHSLGLVFLRNSRELVEKGLFAELGEYEFHVFMDFREIHDDAVGSWSRLCASLNGKGVESLEDELKQLRYAELNSSFRSVLESVPAGVTPKTNKKLISAARHLLTTLAVHTGKPAIKDTDTLTALAACLASRDLLSSNKPASKTTKAHLDAMNSHIGSDTGARLLTSWLLLSGRRMHLTEFGLDYSFKLVMASQEDLPGSAEQRVYTVQLLDALLATVPPGGEISADTLPEKAFSTPAGRAFLLVHESGATEWFNRERFEELLVWSSAIALVELTSHNPAARTISAWLGKSARQNVRLAELAAHAGYRTKLLVQLLRPADKLTVPDKKTAAAHPSKGKKGNDKSRTRTISSKTPDHKVPR